MECTVQIRLSRSPRELSSCLMYMDLYGPEMFRGFRSDFYRRNQRDVETCTTLAIMCRPCDNATGCPLDRTVPLAYSSRDHHRE